LKRIRVHVVRRGHEYAIWAARGRWGGRTLTAEGFDPEVIPPLVDQVCDVMNQLGIEQAAFEGQSMGGWVAMQLALRYHEKVRALVLTTTMGYSPDEGAIPGYAEPDWASNLPSSLEVLRNPSFEAVRTRMARILANPARLTDEAIRVRQALYQQPALAAVQQQFIAEYLAGETILSHQAIQTYRHALRQTRPVIPVLRLSRLRFRLVGIIENTP